MVANAEVMSSVTKNISLVADDISQFGYKQSNELFAMSRAEAETMQLGWARRRFEELAPKITALKDQADQNGVGRIDKLEDLVPLLFNHTVFKSYPLSLLEKNRFDLLTRWFDRLTPIDLSGIDAGQCAGIDDWMTLMETQYPFKIFHTSGTSGKLSFIPRTTLEYDLWMNTLFKNIWYPFGASAQDTPGPGLHLPVIYPTVRYGRYASQQVISYLAEHVAPSPDQVYALTNGTLSADLVSLSGRIRVAQAKGELSKMRLTDAQRIAFKRYIEDLARRPEETAAFFRRIAEQLRGKRVFVSCITNALFQAAEEGIARGITGVFAPDSYGTTGGGGKGTVLPSNWKERVVEFSGIPKSRWQISYGTTELTGPMVRCSEGYYHIPAYFVPFLLDPTSGAPLPRSGTQTGRFAAFDALAQNMWGGIITGDKVTIDWDRDCGCGRKGAHIHDDVERYSESVTGDDKVTCSSTVDNTDAALQSLLAEQQLR
jgi:hypothetical protein